MIFPITNYYVTKWYIVFKDGGSLLEMGGILTPLIPTPINPPLGPFDVQPILPFKIKRLK